MSWLFLLCCVCCKCQGFTRRQIIYPGPNEFFQLSIIHLNDFHARFIQTSATSSACREHEKHECIGGLARVSTASRRLLKEQPNAIFLNAGDNFQGTLWYNLFKWNVTAYFMNKFPFDAMTIGNHEFDGGVACLIPFLRQVRAPVVVANIDDSEEPTLKGLYENSTIIVRSGRRIGVIGVIGQATRTQSKPGKLKFLDEVESINAEADRLTAEGVEIIVVLSHVGLDIDRIIAANCPKVDVIIGGHSHTFLYSGEPPFTDIPADEYPVVVQQKSMNRTALIVQAAAYTRYLGNLTIWFGRQGEVIDWEGNPILLDNSIEEDPEILEELKPWAETVESAGKGVVGETRNFLKRSCGKTNECNLVNLITDAMVRAYKSKAENPDHWTYAAIGCINVYGIRANILPGKITIGDLAMVLPFENSWDVVEVQGKDLYDALEEAAARVKGFTDLQWSGIRVVYNISRPAWSRIQSLSVRCQDCKVPKYEPLNRDKWCRVALVSYIADGKDNIKVMAARHRNRQSGPLDISAFEEFVKFISPFTYEVERRVEFVE